MGDLNGILQASRPISKNKRSIMDKIKANKTKIKPKTKTKTKSISKQKEPLIEDVQDDVVKTDGTKYVGTYQKMMSKTEKLKFVMENLDINEIFVATGIKSTAISAMKIKDKEFSTSKRLLIDPVVKDGLTGEFNIVYEVKRIK